MPREQYIEKIDTCTTFKKRPIISVYECQWYECSVYICNMRNGTFLEELFG